MMGPLFEKVAGGAVAGTTPPMLSIAGMDDGGVPDAGMLPMRAVAACVGKDGGSLLCLLEGADEG